MTATDEFDFTGIEDDILLAGKDAYAPREGGYGGGDSFWAMKANTSKTLYFHTDPWEDNGDGTIRWGSSQGIWFNYRAIFAEAGLAGGVELPPGSREFAVKDQTVVELPDGTRQRQDIRIDSPEADPLLQLVVPYIPRMNKKASAPYRPVADRGAVNVVEIGEGGEEYPKILVLSGPRMAKLKKKLKDYHDMVDGFTCVDKQWVLSLSGQGATEELELRWVKGAPPIDLPEPFDIRVLLQAQRAEILDIVESATGVDVSAVAAAEAAAAEEDVPAYEPPVADEPGAYPEVDKAELYASFTDTRLKNLLAKKGVRIPKDTKREGLLKLALEHDA